MDAFRVISQLMDGKTIVIYTGRNSRIPPTITGLQHRLDLSPGYLYKRVILAGVDVEFYHYNV